MFNAQTLIVCILLWTLGRSETWEPLVPTKNESQIYSTYTNNLLSCSALTAVKGNLTIGGKYLGIVFPTFSLLSRGTVLLEPSTKDCFESVENMPYDPQATSYLNLARNCENSVYWYNYKLSRKLQRKYRKLNKRKGRKIYLSWKL